jgi:hypothetical protein
MKTARLKIAPASAKPGSPQQLPGWVLIQGEKVPIQTLYHLLAGRER